MPITSTTPNRVKAGGGYEYSIWFEKDFEGGDDSTKWEDCEFEVVALEDRYDSNSYALGFPNFSAGIQCPETEPASQQYQSLYEKAQTDDGIHIKKGDVLFTTKLYDKITTINEYDSEKVYTSNLKHGFLLEFTVDAPENTMIWNYDTYDPADFPEYVKEIGIRETKAPDGYELDTTTHVLGISTTPYVHTDGEVYLHDYFTFDGNQSMTVYG